MIKYSKFGIHLKVKDFEKSFKFYNNLDFIPILAYGDDKFLDKFDNKVIKSSEKYRGVVFNLGNSLFEIAEAHISIKPEVFKEDIKSSKVSAMIDVDSLEKVIKICNKNDYEIAVSPKTYPWGTTEIVIRDPDGFILVFREFNK